MNEAKLRAWWWHRQGLDGSLRGASPAAVLERSGWTRSIGGVGPYLPLFARAGTSASAFLARVVTTCPASVVTAGSGCAGHAVGATLPWSGAWWQADATGLPGSAFVLVVDGFATMFLPLSSVIPTALPGCPLHVAPEVVLLAAASAGRATHGFVIPDTPSLAGITFHHQMIVLDAAFTVTATNALSLTVGSF